MSQQDRPFWSPPKFWSQSYLKQLQLARAFSSRLPINWNRENTPGVPKRLITLWHPDTKEVMWKGKKKRKRTRKRKKTPCNLPISGGSWKLQSESRRDTSFQYCRLETNNCECYPQAPHSSIDTIHKSRIHNDPALNKPVRNSRKTPTKCAFRDLLEHEKQTQMAQKCGGFLRSE